MIRSSERKVDIAKYPLPRMKFIAKSFIFIEKISMKFRIFLLISCLLCSSVFAQINYCCYDGVAVLFDPATQELKYYSTYDMAADSLDLRDVYKLDGVDPAEVMHVNISTMNIGDIVVVAFDPAKTSKQEYKVWRFGREKDKLQLKNHYIEVFSKAPEYNGFSENGGFVLTRGKHAYYYDGYGKGSDEARKLYNVPERSGREAPTGVTATTLRVYHIDCYEKSEAQRKARLNNEAKQDQERRDKEAAVAKIEFDNQWTIQQKKEDSLKNLPAGIRIENSTDDLIYCLNAWANQFKSRTDIVTQIAACKNSSASCTIDQYKKLKNLFSDLRDRLSSTASKMSSHYTGAWDQCDSARKYYSQGTNLLDKAYYSFNSAYDAARKIAEQYKSMSDADYNLWVQVMYKAYDEGDVFVQDAFYYLYMGYDRYLNKKCPSLKQGALAKEGNVLLQTLVGWQPILKDKIASADVQRADNEKKRNEAQAKAADAKKKEGKVCPNCNGRGVEQVFEKCMLCGGDGKTTSFKTGKRKVGDKAVYTGTNANDVSTYEIRDVNVTTVEGKEEVFCSACKGKGGRLTNKTTTCHVCHGAKRIYAE